MKRKRYLVAYDIGDPVRLRRVHKTVKGFGDAMQYSVFVCDLTALERSRLVERLRRILKPGFDRVAIIKLGEVDDESGFFFLGMSLPLPADGPRVI